MLIMALTVTSMRDDVGDDDSDDDECASLRARRLLVHGGKCTV